MGVVPQTDSGLGSLKRNVFEVQVPDSVVRPLQVVWSRNTEPPNSVKFA